MDYRDLPYDAEIEYLESTGTQYIDTLYKPNGKTRIKTKGRYTDSTITGNTSMHFLFGVRDGSTFYDVLWNYYRAQGNITYGNYLHYGTDTAEWFNNDINKDVEVDLSYEGGYYNGEKKLTVIDTANQSNYSLYLLWCNKDGVGQATRMPYGRMYYCKIYENNSLVLDLIPVRVGNVGYMYDKVSGQLFGNSGTGSFVLGPDVAPGRYANEIAFLESTGSQYIDTGINADSNMGFSMTYSFTDLSDANYSRIGAIRQSGSDYIRHHTTLDTNLNVIQYMLPVYKKVLPMDASRHTLVLDTVNSRIGYDGEFTTYSEAAFDCNLNYYLFARNDYLNNVASITCAKIKIYQAKIYSNGVLVRDFIPVEYNNIGYLYDKVSGEFFANHGTGKFVLGHRAPRFDGKACARSYTRRQLMMENSRRFSLLYHWEASDGIVNNQWIDRRKGYAFTKNGSPIVTTVSGYEVMRTNYDNYFKVNLNNPALNMGSEWMIAIEFIISVFPTDKVTYILDFGSLDNATHAFGLGVSTTKHVALNVKLTNNNNTFCPPVPPVEFTEYKMSTIIFGAEPYDSTHNNIYTIVGGVKTSASSHPTIANCRFNGNFSRSDGFFGRGLNGNFQSRSWKYIKSIKIYKDNKKR